MSFIVAIVALCFVLLVLFIDIQMHKEKKKIGKGVTTTVATFCLWFHAANYFNEKFLNNKLSIIRQINFIFYLNFYSIHFENLYRLHNFCNDAFKLC